MLSFINPQTSRHIKSGVNWDAFLPVNPTPSTPDTIIATSSIGNYVMTPATGFDLQANGGAIIYEFDYDDWETSGASYQFPFILTNPAVSEYISLRVRSNGDFDFLIVVGGVAVKQVYYYKRNFNILSQRTDSPTGKWRMGVTMRTDGSYEFALNGFVIDYALSGAIIPALDSTSFIGAGRLTSASGYQMGGTFEPVQVEVFNSPLTREELENSTFVDQFIIGDIRDDNLWLVASNGQSNALSVDTNSSPAEFTPTATNMKMLRKDMVVLPYSSPYTQYAPSFNVDPTYAFNNTGGWSGMEKTIDTLGNKYPNKSFGVVCTNRGNIGYRYNDGDGVLNYETNTGGTFTSQKASVQLLGEYLVMMVARQQGNLLAVTSKGGETDTLDATGITEAQEKQTLTDIRNALRLVMPKIYIQHGLHVKPTGGSNTYASWDAVNLALENWVSETNVVFADKYFIDNTTYDAIDADLIHLSDQGQLSMGTDVANTIINAIES